MNQISFEILNKLISEIYPFTLYQLKLFKNDLNFECLSKNKNISWNFKLIKEFEECWDWESLEQNTAVFNKLTLGLLFPEKASLPECNCFLQMDFCENEGCSVNLKKFRYATTMQDMYPHHFIELFMMCDSGFIEESMVKKFYETKNPEDLLRWKRFL